MSRMKPNEIEVYTEVLAAIAAEAKSRRMSELEKEAFKLSMDIYGKDYELDYVKNKVSEYRRIINEQ